MTAQATGSTTARRRARRGEGDKLKEQILSAAEKLLLEKGDENAVSIREIAKAVGVTPPAIYLHFPDKDALFFAVCQGPFSEFAIYLNDAIKNLDSPLETLKEMGRAYVHFALGHPEQYKIMMMAKRDFDPLAHDPDDLPSMQVFWKLVQAASDCIEEGIFRAGDPFKVAVGLWSAVHGLSSLIISHPKFPFGDIEAQIDHLVSAQTEGLVA